MSGMIRTRFGSQQELIPLIVPVQEPDLVDVLFLGGEIAWPEIRGFDGPGGPLFFNLDQSGLHGTTVSLHMIPLGKCKAGIFAELLSFRNLASGRLDPFLFSSMSFFMTDKYKIDSLALSYTSYGIFGGKKLSRVPVGNVTGLYQFPR
jgi:hypothetical protein